MWDIYSPLHHCGVILLSQCLNHHCIIYHYLLFIFCSSFDSLLMRVADIHGQIVITNLDKVFTHHNITVFVNQLLYSGFSEWLFCLQARNWNSLIHSQFILTCTWNKTLLASDSKWRRAPKFSNIFMLTLELHILALACSYQNICLNSIKQNLQVLLSFLLQYATDYKMVAVGNDTNGTTLYQKVGTRSIPTHTHTSEFPLETVDASSSGLEDFNAPEKWEKFLS